MWEYWVMRKYLVVGLLVMTPGFFAMAATPTAEEMWRMIQEQQAQIEALQQELESRDQKQVEGVARESKELVQRIERTEQQMEATASAVEGVLAGGGASAGWADDTHIGGYGELHYNDLDNGEQIDYHRFVLYVTHQFRDGLKFFSELEVEHSLAGEGKPGEVELEQAYVQWDYRDNHNAKFGLFLVPVGILNETHEPDTFYGAERNPVEGQIIPSTWWEAGVGLSGEIMPGWGYDVAVHSGLHNDAGNIRSGRQKVAKANGDSLAYTVRLQYTGIPGFRWSTTLQHQQDLTQGDAGVAGVGEIGATLFETDVALQRGKFGLRALYARWDLDDGVELVAPGADEQTGWYVEPSVRLSKSVGLFARYSAYDLRAGDSLASNEREQLDIGINYWLHENVVLKADFQRQDNDNGNGNDGFNLGVGYSF
jgi:hypothetical protein